ncbi:MAG: hypothetical protein OXI41_12395 [Chloroflexota bacterium]|nr:hypothetical protein [Chloroflexota bacterium]MDE2896401.1 hypothetical protein [Chloroflexota bacterium]
MPNPYHLKARIDRLWRHASSDAPAYRRLKSLNAVVRELFARNDRARRNHQLYHATDPFDVARHLLRDLYDHGDPLIAADDGSLPLPAGTACPALDAECWGEGPLALPEEDDIEEDDDPL